MSRCKRLFALIVIVAAPTIVAFATPAKAQDPCEPYEGRQVTVEGTITKVSPPRERRVVDIRGAKIGNCRVDGLVVRQHAWPQNCTVGRTARVTGSLELDVDNVFISAHTVTCR